MLLVSFDMCVYSSPHITYIPWPACGWNQLLKTAADCEFIVREIQYSPQQAQIWAHRIQVLYFMKSHILEDVK